MPLSHEDSAALVARLQQYLTDNNLGLPEFAQRTDVDRTALHRILSGRTKSIREATYRTIVAAIESGEATVSEKQMPLTSLEEADLWELLRMQQFLQRPIQIREIPSIVALGRNKG